jgi:glycosyltransferase involved in cell wall biosynthesis
LGKQENVIAVPKIPHHKMNEVYNICDFVLFPSRYEGNSLTVLEAAACKKAIICSETGLLKTEKQFISEYICNTEKDYIRLISNFLINKNDIKYAEEKWHNFSLKYPIKKQIIEITKMLKSL